MAKRKKKHGRPTSTKKRRKVLSSLMHLDLGLRRINATTLYGKRLDEIKEKVKRAGANNENPIPHLRKIELISLSSRYLPVNQKESLIATLIVKNSVEDVLRSIDIERLAEAMAVKRIDIQSSMGPLVATRAVRLASEYVSSGRYGGDMDMHSVIESIATSGIAVRIGSSGDASVKVKRSSPKGRRSVKHLRGSLDGKYSQVKTSKRKGEDVVHHCSDGTTIINLHLNIHIDSKLVHQLIVEPKEVNNYIGTHPTSLVELIDNAISGLNDDSAKRSQDTTSEESYSEKKESEKTESEKEESEETKSKEGKSEETESEEEESEKAE